MNINKMPIAYNFSKRNSKVRFIVVHDTGNPSRGANAMAHYKYFNGGNRRASAHFFVDDKEIVETVEVSLSAWHCGDGRGKYGIWNYNSIGVELCINSDSDFTKTKANALNLIRFLMKAYNIPKSNVIRHYDASRKICPRSMSANNWREWWIFREMI
ncbi:MAG: peptidoglycan recognition protein family protein [Peptoniphilaceae bacterium]